MTSARLGQKVRGAGIGTDLISARFMHLYDTGFSQSIGSPAPPTWQMTWNTLVWDDIGFPTSYGPYPGDGVFIFPDGSDGEYLVTVYALFDPQSSAAAGISSIDLIIYWDNIAIPSDSPINLMGANGVLPQEVGLKLNATVVHRFWAGNLLYAYVTGYSLNDETTIAEASISITKLRSIAPA